MNETGLFCRLWLCGSVILLSGCVIEGPLSVRRIWMDKNTLNTPALYYDKIHHLPMSSPKVKQLRWMYGHPPMRTDLPNAPELIYADHNNEATHQPLMLEPPTAPLPPLPGPGHEESLPPLPPENTDDKPRAPSKFREFSGPTAANPQPIRQRAAERISNISDGWRFLQ
ncbi:MAG: hypothetical protein Tsb009_07690 [Planctomycetaceae bacterium]